MCPGSAGAFALGTSDSQEAHLPPCEARPSLYMAYLCGTTRFLLHMLSGSSYMGAPTMDSSLSPL